MMLGVEPMKLQVVSSARLERRPVGAKLTALAVGILGVARSPEKVRSPLLVIVWDAINKPLSSQRRSRNSGQMRTTAQIANGSLWISKRLGQAFAGSLQDPRGTHNYTLFNCCRMACRALLHLLFLADVATECTGWDLKVGTNKDRRFTLAVRPAWTKVQRQGSSVRAATCHVEHQLGDSRKCAVKPLLFSPSCRFALSQATSVPPPPPSFPPL